MAKGHVERLPSGSYRVSVYAGKDPLTGKQIYLRETAKDEERAYIALGKLLAKASSGATPETGATVERLLEVYMDVAELDASTRNTYAGFIRRTINPALGHLKLRRLRGPLLDTFYAKLRRCGNVACTGKPFVDHRYVPPPLRAGSVDAPYRQLAAGLHADIASGVLTPGEKLPSVKTLATAAGLATDTVQKALRELRADGLITGRQGSGTYVTDALPAPATTRPPKPRKHTCKLAGCAPHTCTPMQAGTIRQIHAILTGALAAAARWDWIDSNPMDAVKPPTVVRRAPATPSSDDVAALIAHLQKAATSGTADSADAPATADATAASGASVTAETTAASGTSVTSSTGGSAADRAATTHTWLALAVYIWLAAVTGARRGELCALRWHRIRRVCHRCTRKRPLATETCPRCEADPGITAEAEYDPAVDSGLVTISRNYLVRAGQHIDKDTKTHQDRTLALDPATCAVLATLQEAEASRLAKATVRLSPEAYVFSNDGGTTPWNPDWTTHRVQAAAKSAGVQINIKSLRHYSATELLAAGIDLRNAAHRLGHGSGGAITLRVYAHPVTEVDQRAATLLAKRLHGGS